MNILFLSELFYPHGGGAELATYLYAKLLAEAKFNVIVVTNRFSWEPEFSSSEGFRVYRLPLFGKAENVKFSILKRVDVLLSVFMRKLLRWADVVYVPRFWFFAIPVSKALGKPVIVHLHDYIPICPLATFFNLNEGRVCENAFCSVGCIYGNERRKRGLVKAAESTLLNLSVWRFLRGCIDYSDAVVCVSKAQRDILARYAPWLASKLRVIYNPLPKLSPLPMDGDDFGYFGGASYMKGFQVLMKALEYRKLRGLDSVTVHGTKFSGIDPQFAGFLKDLGFLVYGKLASDEYELIYRKVKAVVVPSVCEEPLPYVVAEALSSGRSVIASRVGGIPELVEGCRGVFLFNSGDYRQLAEEIVYVNSLSRESAVDLGLWNRETFMKNFSNEKTLKDFLGILQ